MIRELFFEIFDSIEKSIEELKEAQN